MSSSCPASDMHRVPTSRNEHETKRVIAYHQKKMFFCESHQVLRPTILETEQRRPAVETERRTPRGKTRWRGTEVLRRPRAFVAHLASILIGPYANLPVSEELRLCVDDRVSLCPITYPCLYFLSPVFWIGRGILLNIYDFFTFLFGYSLPLIFLSPSLDSSATKICSV